MLSTFSNSMQIVNDWVWGPPTVVLLIGTGLYLTVRLRFIQLRHFKHAIECISGKYDNPEEEGDISHFQALCAALSATIGTGNIAGVASLGIGCAVQSNSVVDGLLSVMPESWQKVTFATKVPVLGDTAMVKPILGLVLAFFVGVVTIGGIRRIAKVASRVVPFMCVAYVGSALFILIGNADLIPDAFAQIFRYAFTPMAAGGGFLGTVVSRTIQKGVARGVFSNESGLGSAPIAHAAAKTKEMIREGFVAMLGPFIDTLLICTLTALVIITSGVWQVRSRSGELLYGPNGKGQSLKMTIDGEEVLVVGTVQDDPVPVLDEEGRPYELPTSAALTASAFEKELPRIGHVLVAFALVFFAYSTMISWSYYGDRCFEYLLGPRAITPYRYVFCFFVLLGAVGGLELVWTIADNLNALMAIPNLVGLLGLGGVVVKESRDYVGRVIRQDPPERPPYRRAP